MAFFPASDFFGVKIAGQRDVFEHRVTVNWCCEFAVNFAFLK